MAGKKNTQGSGTLANLTVHLDNHKQNWKKKVTI